MKTASTICLFCLLHTAGGHDGSPFDDVPSTSSSLGLAPGWQRRYRLPDLCVGCEEQRSEAVRRRRSQRAAAVRHERDAAALGLLSGPSERQARVAQARGYLPDEEGDVANPPHDGRYGGGSGLRRGRRRRDRAAWKRRRPIDRENMRLGAYR